MSHKSEDEWDIGLTTPAFTVESNVRLYWYKVVGDVYRQLGNDKYYPHQEMASQSSSKDQISAVGRTGYVILRNKTRKVGASLPRARLNSAGL